MPIEQTKQEIEAEPADIQKHKAIRTAHEVIVELEKWEAALREAEKELWQPHWSHDDPLRDRLLRIGRSPEQVAEI